MLQRRPTDLDPKPVPLPQPATTSHGLIVYVHTAPGPTHQAVRYDLDAGRGEVIAESPDAHIALRTLPARWLYFDRPLTKDEQRRAKGTQSVPVYVDAYEGTRVHPDGALGLGDGRVALIDVYEERALIARQDAESDPDDPTATLVLHDESGDRELGRLFRDHVVGEETVRCFGLSPDRNHLVWTGPEGTFLADITTGDVRKREHEAVLDTRASSLVEARTFRWLPDSSGLLEQWWEDGKPRWQVYQPDGDGPTAEGQGRIRQISPDASYWAVVNDDLILPADLRPGHSPYLVQPVPDHTPVPGATVANREWTIHDETVEFYTTARTGPDTFATVRVTPTGFKRLSNLDLRHADRVGNTLAVAEQTPGGWQVKLTDLRTGRDTVVLSGLADPVSVRPAGNRHFVATVMRTDTQALMFHLYIGGADGKHWKRLAEDVWASATVPPQPRDQW